MDLLVILLEIGLTNDSHAGGQGRHYQLPESEGERDEERGGSGRENLSVLCRTLCQSQVYVGI